MTEALEKVSIQERAFSLLKTMIGDGRLAPGERLLEAEVAKAFGISRSPARHALAALCDEKLIREIDGRGYQVAGASSGAPLGRRAVIDAVKLSPVAQWETMYGRIEQEICARTFFASVRVIEERLAEHFGVSRTVVRDVLARMHSVGLVSKDPLGRWVSHRVTPERTRHLYEMRWLLEPEALRRAAARAPAGFVEQARDRIVQALDGFPREGFDTDVVEHDLHVHLLSYCENDEILAALSRTHTLFVPTRYLYDPVLHIPLDLIESALREHRQIYDLLLELRPDAAAAKLHEHLRRAEGRWQQRFESAASATQPPLPPYLVEIGSS